MLATPCKPLLPLSPYNSRAVLCAEHKANHFVAAVRRALASTLQRLVKDNQSGAIRGGGTDVPMFLASLFLMKASTHRCTGALLFVDIRKALHSVVLELVLGPLLTQVEHEALMEGSNMDALRKPNVLVDLEQKDIVCLTTFHCPEIWLR